MLAQPGEALRERRRLALDALGREAGQAPERPHDAAQRAVAVHREHPDHRARAPTAATPARIAAVANQLSCGSHGEAQKKMIRIERTS